MKMPTIDHRRFTAALLVVVTAATGRLALGQVVNPADAQKRPEEEPETAAPAHPPEKPSAQTAPGATAPAETRAAETPPRPVRLRSWELPPVTVVGERGTGLREEDLVGTYRQPRWTATRRFPGTRVYVRPEGKIEFEYWLRPTFPRHGDPVELRSLWELEIGLPHRLQLDLYFRTDQEGDKGEMLTGQQVELRYALADWDVIPGNPTLYFEWVGLEQRPDKIEPKLLLGGEIAPRWHWGLNLVGELELGGERENEYAITGGISYTVLDSELSVGGEVVATIADVKDARGAFGDSEAVYIGPSLQYHPMPQVTLNLAPLLGVTDDSADARMFFTVGYEF